MARVYMSRERGLVRLLKPKDRIVRIPRFKSAPLRARLIENGSVNKLGYVIWRSRCSNEFDLQLQKWPTCRILA